MTCYYYKGGLFSHFPLITTSNCLYFLLLEDIYAQEWVSYNPYSATFVQRRLFRFMAESNYLHLHQNTWITPLIYKLAVINKLLYTIFCVYFSWTDVIWKLGQCDKIITVLCLYSINNCRHHLKTVVLYKWFTPTWIIMTRSRKIHVLWDTEKRNWLRGHIMNTQTRTPQKMFVSKLVLSGIEPGTWSTEHSVIRCHPGFQYVWDIRIYFFLVCFFLSNINPSHSI